MRQECTYHFPIMKLPKLTSQFAVRAILLIVVAAMLGRIAWLSDDSLITLRTVLNISHGWGYGFNALENVQGYTHPLWMLIWLFVGSLTGSWTFSILFVSLLFAISAVLLILRLTNNILLTITAAALILGSNAITEYSTSGLENPLAFVLIIGLFILLRKPHDQTRMPLIIGFLASLTLLTRLDLALLIAPALAYSVLSEGYSRARFMAMTLLGFVTPLLLWFSFSVLTYGSAFPNTLSAKRNVNIPLLELIQQGLFYLGFSIKHDVITGLIIALGVVVAIVSADRLAKAWTFGVALYLLYVIQNGGDFMASRFLSAPAIVSVAVVVSFVDTALSSSAPTKRYALLLAPMAAVFVSLSVIERPTVLRSNLLTERWDYVDPSVRGIADERAVYTWMGLSPWSWRQDPSSFEGHVTIGVAEREADYWPSKASPMFSPERSGKICGFLGSYGINSGPTTHLIDSCGLTDRFLAETKFDPEGKSWRIGHFERQLPEGYEDAIKYSDPSHLVDPDEEARLRELWKVIRD